MTSYASAISTPAAGIVTALATAVSDAQALSIALAPGTGGALTGAGAFLAGCTLSGLATSNRLEDECGRHAGRRRRPAGEP